MISVAYIELREKCTVSVPATKGPINCTPDRALLASCPQANKTCGTH